MDNINRILAFYFLALSLLFASVAVSLFLTDRIAVELAEDAAHINTSGRQRMLSQRIIYLAHDLADAPSGATQPNFANTAAEFEAALDLFENSHANLTRLPDMDPALSKIYFSDSDGPSLDMRVRHYIALGRLLADDPTNAENLAALKTIERAGLLDDLDAAVARIEEISVLNVAWIRQAEYVALLVAGGIVLLEILFVFLPGHRLVKNSMRAISEKAEELAASRKTLDRQNEELAAHSAALRREQVRLQDALDESELLRREQAEFTYAVSHDLKSPANSLSLQLGEIEHLLGADMGDDLREMLDQSHRTVKRMSTLVEDVLAYAWSTDTREEAVSVEMGDVVGAALGNLDAEIRTSGAAVTVGAMGKVVGYPRQLEMLVQNLVSNAIKYCPRDRTPEVSIELGTDAYDETVLSVRDKSGGIPEEHLDRVFGMFQRLHRQDEVPGSGLGLCTCKRVAENHGGSISIRSSIGEGTTFNVSLMLDLDGERLAA